MNGKALLGNETRRISFKNFSLSRRVSDMEERSEAQKYGVKMNQSSE